MEEAERAARLLDAQAQAEILFAAIESDLMRPGVSELQLNGEIKALARDLLGVEQHWHKRIVRTGPNTLHPYRENPPDRVVADDDIAFVDLGPVFEAWEADFGRTYVFGDDPEKLRLRDDLAVAWQQGKEFFQADPTITGAELYAYAQGLAAERGWEFGGDIAGHLVGEFPHERLADDRSVYICADNPNVMRGLDTLGRKYHWILEIHLVDREREIGGFYEQLLTVG